MKKSQLNALNALLEDPEIKGKDGLKHFIWLNTVEPKYAVGEYHKVTNRRQMILGIQVVDFNAVVKRPYSFKNSEEYYYELETTVKRGNREYTTKICVPEDEVGKLTDTSINEFPGECEDRTLVECLSM